MKVAFRFVSGGLLVLPALLCLAPADVTAAVVLQDGFDDGDRTNGADALDTQWWLLWPSADNQDGIVAPDIAPPGGLGADNAFQITATDIRALQMGGIPAVNLANPGDYVKLSFNVRFTGWPAPSGSSTRDAARDAFRFGIEHDGGTPAAADGLQRPLADDDAGYFATISANPAVVSRLYAGNPPGQINSPFKITIQEDELDNHPTSPPPEAITSTDPRSYVLTVTRGTTGSALVKLQADYCSVSREASGIAAEA